MTDREPTLHPILARYKKQLLDRLAERRRQELPHQAGADYRHRERLLTWGSAGRVGSAPGYFRIWYCPDCLQGRIGDFTYDQPNVPSYRELEVTIRRNWNPVCEARKP